MKIDAGIPQANSLFPTSSSTMGQDGFAAQLQQLKVAQQGSSGDVRSSKLRDIASRYDLDRLTYTQCRKMCGELAEAGFITSDEIIFVFPLERGLDGNGNWKPQAELDSMIVNPRPRMDDLLGQQLSRGKMDGAASMRKLMALYDQMLSYYHSLKARDGLRDLA